MLTSNSEIKFRKVSLYLERSRNVTAMLTLIFSLIASSFDLHHIRTVSTSLDLCWSHYEQLNVWWSSIFVIIKYFHAFLFLDCCSILIVISKLLYNSGFKSGKSKWIFITYGTSHFFTLANDRLIVSLLGMFFFTLLSKSKNNNTKQTMKRKIYRYIPLV